MKIKKLLKYSLLSIMTTGLVLATSSTTPIFLKNNQTNQIATSHFENVNDEYTNEINYIKDSIAKETGIENSIKSIEFADDSGKGFHVGVVVTKTDGSTLLYMWGNNGLGQLGLTDTKNRNTPEWVSENLAGKTIKQVAIGDFHSAALLDDGSLYMWGQNSYGQLGLDGGNPGHQPTPALVTIPNQNNKKIIQIDLGASHSAALLDDGSLYMWGQNDYGQLGLGPDKPGNQRTPQQVTIPSLNERKIAKISLGTDFSAGLLDDGSLYMWGKNDYGQLGNATNNGNTNSNPIPTQVTIPDLGEGKIKQLALGESHTSALVTKADGSTLLYMWGRNYHGQLGFNRNIIPNPKPTKVAGLQNQKISQIALGNDHSAALLDDGSLYTWGSNEHGELGLGAADNDYHPSPEQVIIPDLGTRKIAQLMLGTYLSGAQLDDGSLYMWGNNNYGQLGFAGNHTSTPTWMIKLGKDSHITALPGLTAKQAVINMWVSNGFSISGFKKSFSLTNILDTIGQEITMSSQPTYDHAGNVTMNIGIKYFYDENGKLIANTAAKPMIITGFKNVIFTTIITGKTQEFPIDIGTWEKNAINEDKLDRRFADEYLELTEVPPTAQFTISNKKMNYKSGVATFDIVSDQVYVEGGNKPEVENSNPFPITLNLIPQITVMTPFSTGYPANLTVNALKEKLFGTGTTVINKSALETYMTVEVPVEDVIYHLIENSWVSQPGDGTLQFSIYADKYYDSEGNKQTGSATTPDSVVNFDLILQREVSSIKVLPTPLKKIRVDKFEEYITQNDNAVVRARLAEFLDLNTVPTDAIFTINTAKPVEYGDNLFRNQLILNLTIDKFNISADETASHTQNLTLVLEPQYLPTTFTLKTTELINVSVQQFISSFASDETNVDNISVLEQYIDIKPYPSDATFSISLIDKNIDTGIISFKLTVNQGYDGNSDLANITSDPLTFKLLPKKQPFAITVNPNIDNPDDVDEFIKQAWDLSGTAALKNYLFPKYLMMTGDLPPNTIFQVQSLKKDVDEANGIVFLKIYPGQYYDDNDVIKPGMPTEETFNIQLKGPLSKIRIRTGYPADIPVGDFLKMIQANNVFDRTAIEQYFILTNVPTNAVFTIKDPKLAPFQNGITNNITFNLETSIFNKGNQSPEVHIQKFTLALGPQHAPTNIEPKTPYDNSLKVADVYNKLQTLTGDDLTNYLKNFLEIYSLPEGTTFTILDLPPDVPTEGKLSFSVLPSQVYDNDSNITTENIAPIEVTLELGKVYSPTTITQKTPTTPVRIDTFVNDINSLKGQTLYDYLIADYINAESVFDPATMTVHIETQNQLTGDITIKLTVTGYYDENSNLVNQAKSYTFDYQLTPKYNSTSINVLDNYAKDITPEQFKQQIVDDGATINGDNYVLSSTNITYLSKYITFNSIPSNTIYTLTWNDDLTDNLTGVLNFNLSLNQHYADGDYKNAVLPVNNLVLNLAPQPVDEEVVTYPPTVLTTNPNAPLIKSAQDFIDIVYPNGIVNLQMLRTYVNGLDTLPSSASITNLSIKDSSVVTFTLAVSAHYDSAGILAGATTYDFNLGLTPKYTPTVITALPDGIYPKDLTPGAFKQQIIDDGASISGNNYSLTATNIEFLKRFLDLSTVPANTTYTLVFNDVDDIMGQLDFSLMLNQFYDNDGELVNDGTSKTFHGLKLNLTPVDTPFAYPETLVTVKNGAPKVTSVEDFLKMIYDVDGDLLRSTLNQFIDGLESIPWNAKITITFVNKYEGIANFEMHVSHFYDNEGTLQTEEAGTPGKTYSFSINVVYNSTVEPIAPETKTDSLLWLWIVLAIAGAAIIGLSVWLIIKKTKNNSDE